MKIFITFCVIFCGVTAFGQNDSLGLQYHTINNELQYGYNKPKALDFFTNIPKNYLDLGKGLGDKKNLMWIGLTAAVTGVMIPGDQVMTDHVQIQSNSTAFGEPHTYQKVFLGVEVPTNLSATFYHFGHGNVSLLFAGGFLAAGLIGKDYRAVHTSIEIGESIITLGVMTQGLKRVFGRQSPNRSTVDGGKWHFFPNWKEYMNNTPYYDAMPSGHMATLVSTITVISKNYPEVKWIRPLGYTMATILGVEMINSGVHWASDYPLGILIGYSVATVSVNRRITKVYNKGTSYHNNKIQPQFFVSSWYGVPVYGLKAEF